MSAELGFKVAIPARYASTRLPGKPLRTLGDMPLLHHVYLRALASGAADVVIATDDARIYDVAAAFGAAVYMTDPGHASGTDRLAELADKLGWDDDAVIVNLQGDEPFMPAALLRQVAEDLIGRPGAAAATVCSRLHTADDLFDPHAVKVVRDAHGYALYFSRAPIPWQRDAFTHGRAAVASIDQHYLHIGLYAYRAKTLRHYAMLPACAIEQAEALEQLRLLWNGLKIYVAEANAAPGLSIDTEDDLKRARILYSQNG